MIKTLLVPPELEIMAKCVNTHLATQPVHKPLFEIVVLHAMPPGQFVLVDEAGKYVFYTDKCQTRHHK